MNYQRLRLSGGKIGLLSDDFIRNISFDTVCQGAIIGAAGGLAEIMWVTLYAGATGVNPAMLARGVTTAAGVSASLPITSLTLGVTIHMSLAVMLGVMLTVVWQALILRWPETVKPFPFMITALLGVWSINFFLVLPRVSPAFVHLLPFPVSLISKVLFGLAAAAVLRRQHVVQIATGYKVHSRRIVQDDRN